MAVWQIHLMATHSMRRPTDVALYIAAALTAAYVLNQVCRAPSLATRLTPCSGCAGGTTRKTPTTPRPLSAPIPSLLPSRAHAPRRLPSPIRTQSRSTTSCHLLRPMMSSPDGAACEPMIYLPHPTYLSQSLEAWLPLRTSNYKRM